MYTYACLNLLLYRVNYFVNSTPLVLVLGAALNNAEAFQDVDDVVDAAAFYTQLFCALVKVQKTSLRCSVEE